MAELLRVKGELKLGRSVPDCASRAGVKAGVRSLQQGRFTKWLTLPQSGSVQIGADGEWLVQVSDNVRLPRGQHRIPDGGRTSIFEAQPTEIELSLVDPAQQFDAGDRNCRCPERLEPAHRTAAQLDAR